MKLNENNPGTVGLEFESVIAKKIDMVREIDKSPVLRWVMKSTHDASVESSICSLGAKTSIFLGNALLRNKTILPGKKDISGYEAVTVPLDMQDMRRVIDSMTSLQVKMGELYSPRSSIHVHLGFPRGLLFKRLAVAVGLAVEPLFYKIAGMGREFRGSINHSAYCRPLDLPPAVKLEDSNRFALLNPQKAVDAESERGFWGCFGVDPRERERYTPLRYMAINIFSTQLRGTLEFRFFNFSTVSRHIKAVVGLSQFITEMSLKISREDAFNLRSLSIFDINANSDYHQLFENILETGRRSGVELDIIKEDEFNIRDLIETTPQPVFKKENIMSHVTTSKLSIQSAMEAGLEIIDSADPPGITDIHNFENLNTSLIGDW